MRPIRDDRRRSGIAVRPVVAAVAAVVFAGSGAFALSASAASGTVTIGDAAFAACLAAELGTGQTGTDADTSGPGNVFDTDDLASVIELHCDATDGTVASLAGASSLTGLTDLTLLDSTVSDLSPLSGLGTLTSLSVHSSRLADVSALASLGQLQSLDLDSPTLSDVSPLSHLTSLTQLNLTAPVASLAPLSSMTKLTTLGVDSSAVSDLSPLSGLTALKSLQLTTPAVGDVSALSRLTGLTQLGVDTRLTSDLTPLAGLTGLTSLSLSGPAITTIAPLSRLTGLTCLALTDSQVSDVGIVAGFGKLTELHLDRDQVSDLSPLRVLTGLSVLSVDDNLVTDPSPLAALVQLDSLSLVDNQLTDVSALKTLVNYYWLDLSGNQIVDISPLKITGKDANRHLKVSDQVDPLPVEVGVATALPLKSLDGSLPTLTPDAGVTVSSGKVTVGDTGAYQIGFTSGVLDTDGYTFSGVVTIGSNTIVPGTPTIMGTAAVGSVLTANEGRWGPAPVGFSYQWLADGTPISGAIAKTYTAQSGDLGKQLSVAVTGSKSGYADVTATSTATAAVVAPLVASAVPVVSGTVAIGSTLHAQTDGWDPAATLTYQWLRKGTPIADAQKVDYTVQDADAGSALAVAVTGARADYTSVTVTSAATSAVPPLGTFTTAPVPTVSGTQKVGYLLTARTGTWKPAVAAYAYQWLRAGTEIPGATDVTYELTGADAGSAISVKVTATSIGFTPLARTSKATSKVAAGALAAVTPKLAQTRPVVDTTVSAQQATWGPGTVSLSYQWYKVSAKGKSTAISGANTASYPVAGSVAGYRLKVKVTGTRTGYATTSRYSTATSAVAKAQFTAVSAASASASVAVDDGGTPRVGKLLTATPGTYAPTATYRYQWYRGSTAIKKATNSTYRLAASDRGKVVRVRVTASRTGYVSKTVDATVSGTVQAGLAAVTPKLSDTSPAVGQGLSITGATGVDRWTPVPTTVHYRWLRNGTAIAGAADSPSYTVQAADLGARISVEITGGSADYASVTVTSAASSKVGQAGS